MKKEGAKKKPAQSNLVLIPSSVFKDRTLSILESLVEYLLEKENLSYHQIAVLLNRNDRTIWTVQNRLKNKRRANFLAGLKKIK